MALVVLAGVVLSGSASGPAAPISLPELTSRPRPHATERISWGPGPSQFADFWKPDGKGPFPVAVLIHGGCWQAAFGLDLMDYAAEDLRRHGVAVWNIEYRRLGEPGGGYPGTFADVGAALDHLRQEAPRRHLALDRLVVVGHSAGGHLGLWAAGRSRLPSNSPLRTRDPLKIGAVISLGGVADLETPSQACGGDATVRDLVGPATASRHDPFADTAPLSLEPFAARQVLVHGESDTIAPVSMGEIYKQKAHRKGAEVELQRIRGQGHFDLIAPGSPAWETNVRPLILRAVGR